MEFLMYLLKSTAVLSLFLLIYEVLLKRETIFQSNRFFLLSGMLMSVVLPLLYFKKTIQITKILPAAPTTDSSVLSDSILWDESFTEVVPVSFWESLDRFQILIAVYSIIAILLIIKFLWSMMTLHKFFKNLQFTSLKNGIRYYETQEETGPFSFFNRIVYNPKLHDSNDLPLILKHEKAHAKAYHSIDLLLANIMTCLFWFNPLMYVYRKRISQNLEFLADQAATQNLTSPKAYQLSLLSCVKAKVVALPVNNFHKSFIQTRIKKLHQNNSKKSAVFKVTFILPFLMGFFFLFQIQTKAETHYITQEVVSESDYSTSKTDQLSLSTTLDKNTTNKDLKAFQVLLEEEFGVDFSYQDIQRNLENQLTKIQLKLKNKTGTIKDLSVSNKGNAIQDILIEINQDDQNPLVLKMAKSHEIVKSNQDLSHKIYQYTKQHDTFIFNGKTRELKDFQDAYFNGSQISFNEDASQMYISGQPLPVKNMKEALNQSEGQVLVNFSKENEEIKSLVMAVNKYKFSSAQSPKSATENQILLAQKIEAKIVKTTTEESLKEIQEMFKSNQIDFSYAALSYDEAGNLTQIALELTTQDGKTRKYSVIGDKPIPEIHVIVSDDFTGFQTFQESQKPISTEEGSIVILTGKPTKGLDDKLRAALTQSGIKVVDSTKKTTDMIKSIDVRKSDQYPLIIIKGKDVHEEDGSQPHKTVVVGNKLEVFTIDKQTTDVDLEKIKAAFAQNEIDLNYRVANRNQEDEITKIKITITNKKGKKSSVNYQNNKGITPFKLGTTEDGFFIE